MSRGDYASCVKESRPYYKYGTRYGFPPLKGSKEWEKAKRERRKKYQKVKLSIPALGFEHIFSSIKECAETFNIAESRIYTYARQGYAAKGILEFKIEDKNI